MRLEYSFIPLKNGTKFTQKLVRNDYPLEIGNIWVEEKKNKVKITKSSTTSVYGDFRRSLYDVVKTYYHNKKKRVIDNGTI